MIFGENKLKKLRKRLAKMHDAMVAAGMHGELATFVCSCFVRGGIVSVVTTQPPVGAERTDPATEPFSRCQVFHSVDTSHARMLEMRDYLVDSVRELDAHEMLTGRDVALGAALREGRAAG